MDYAKESLKKHAEWGGKIEVISTVPCRTKEDLSLAYTPGVAQPCLEIQKDVNKSYELTPDALRQTAGFVLKNQEDLTVLAEDEDPVPQHSHDCSCGGHCGGHHHG